ncbi:MAG: ROK family protein [Kiritimatiellaeota bacterium]|nr:ROK family protein [Kiritimatiellota bacterium]
MFLLGINIGGTTCSAVLGDASGAIHRRAEWKSLAHEGFKPMMSRIIENSRAMLRDDVISGAGASVGGPMNGNTGRVLSPPHLPGWDDVPLADILRDGFGAPARVEHDAVACALAEYLWGGVRSPNAPLPKGLAYFTCGTGFGAGFIINGTPYYAASGFPPELGHLLYCREENCPESFGKAGSFDAFASMSGSTAIHQWRNGGDALTPRQIQDLAEAGNAAAQETLRILADATGEAVAIAADLFGIDVAALGSAARYLGEAWIAQVRERANASAGAWNKFTVCASTLGERLQDLSALAAATRAGL